MWNIRKRDTITKEYIEVIVNRKLVQLCKGCYHALGWKTIRVKTRISSVKLSLERIRKIKNRVELSKLQWECEDALIELESLIKTINNNAKRIASISGVVGFIFIIGGFIANALQLFNSIILSVFGFTWLVVVSLVLHKKVRKENEIYLAEMNQYYDAIYNICKKAEHLIC